MSTTRDVAVFVGSLRKESFNRKMANALIAMAAEPLKLEIVEIRQLPLYNQDDDANPPAASAAFQQRVLLRTFRKKERVPLSLFGLHPQVVEALLQFADTVEAGPLLLPAHVQLVELLLLVSALGLQPLEPLLAGGIVLLFKRQLLHSQPVYRTL